MPGGGFAASVAAFESAAPAPRSSAPRGGFACAAAADARCRSTAPRAVLHQHGRHVRHNPEFDVSPLQWGRVSSARKASAIAGASAWGSRFNGAVLREHGRLIAIRVCAQTDLLQWGRASGARKAIPLHHTTRCTERLQWGRASGARKAALNPPDAPASPQASMGPCFGSTEGGSVR